MNDRYKNDKSEFLVLYGRRRIGKTELLRHFVEGKNYIFYACTECTDKEQLSRFSKSLLSTDTKLPSNLAFNSWDDAFTYIKNLSKDEKLVIVIDEFPYMVYNNTSIPSILQNLWDSELKNENIMLILCGSSMSFIENEILASKNPLYGRTTGTYKLDELSIFDASPFFKDYSFEDLITVYSILGGVPQYLLNFNPDYSIEDNIKKNVLTRGTSLYDEVDFLMRQELRETSTYYTIIEAIALGNTKLNDIYQKTEIDKHKLIAYLNNLINLDIIEREYPATEKLKKKVNIQLGLYKIKTNYFSFYFKYIFPNKSLLEQGDILGIYKNDVALTLSEYVSYSFEKICIKYLVELNKKERLPFWFKNIGRWWNKDTEVDIVAFNKGSYIFGECKWRNEKTSLRVLEDLKNKADLHPDAKTRYFYIFSKSDFSDELVRYAEVNKNVFLVGLGEIFGVGK